jgi:hypothetical protein
MYVMIDQSSIMYIIHFIDYQVKLFKNRVHFGLEMEEYDIFDGCTTITTTTTAYVYQKAQGFSFGET